jgi:hypothetical protein
VKKVIGLVIGFGLIFAAASAIASAQTVSPTKYLQLIQSGVKHSPTPAPYREGEGERDRRGRR